MGKALAPPFIQVSVSLLGPTRVLRAKNARFRFRARLRCKEATRLTRCRQRRHYCQSRQRRARRTSDQAAGPSGRDQRSQDSFDLRVTGTIEISVFGSTEQIDSLWSPIARTTGGDDYVAEAAQLQQGN